MRARPDRPHIAVWIAALILLSGLSNASAQTNGGPRPQRAASTSLETAVDAAKTTATATHDATSLANRRGSERERNARQVVADRERQQNEAKARAAERERAAVQKLEEARIREERERNATLRKLRARERQLAERSLEETREHSARLVELQRESRTNLEELADRKAKLLDALDAIPRDASEQTRREEVDPLFDNVLQLRREAHEQFGRALRTADVAEESLSERRDALDDAAEQLRRDQQRMDELESSQVWERRVALAKARLELERQRHLHAREIVRALRERVRDYHSRFGFFAGTIEPLLERISDERRDAYFDLGDSANWQMAADGLGTGVRALEERVEHRMEQLDSSSLATLEFWAWAWGLFWRLIALMVVAFLALEALIWLVDRICAGLLRRRLFRRNATLFVKLAEMLRAVSRPTLYFIAIAFTADYAARSIPELLGLVWIVDAVFIYWIIIQASRVAILPRSHRRREGEASADDLDYIDEARADDLADITGVDLPRARKLLRSIRVIAVFWLFAAYLPDFLKPLTGITVVWWLVDVAATWGFIAVVYWVLSSWRDEIAAVFEKLAGERLAPAVAFVQRHKARPWGVLVIAVTSLYVVFKEIVIVMRRYVIDTDVFKRLNALAFRTQIEMQNRSRSDRATTVVPPEQRLDPEYLRFFEPRPLDDETYRVEREGYADGILEHFETWKHQRRRGSVAVSGDAGVGKTTLLNEVHRRLADEDLRTVRPRLNERITRRAPLLSFLAEVFELETIPEDVSAFVAAVRELDSRIIVIDDCHLCFSRHIEHFDAIDALLDIVHLCDGRHFFVLAFARHAWRYIDRVEDRGHCFGDVLELAPWEPEALQELIEKRNAASGYSASFASLVAAHADTGGDREVFDVIETARGYFGYLHGFSGGNPRVAMLYWVQSLHPSERENVLDVDLFERPDTSRFATFSDDHWFALAALAQHGGLNAGELAEIMDRSVGFCTRAIDYFAENDIVVLDQTSGTAMLSALYWRPVLRRLASSRFLFGA